jgi:uncharacterized protein (PEP-CTERM system associated)
MAITVMDTKPNKLVKAVTLLTLISANTVAGDWKFEPNLKIDETHSNNVNLTVDDEVSSLVSQAGLAVDTSFSSNKVDFNLTSTSLYAMYSHDHDLDTDFHTLDSSLKFRLWPDGLSLTGQASISNQARNSSRNALADIVSGDTVKIERYTGGLEYSVRNSQFVFNTSANYQITESEDNIGEREGTLANLATQNGSAARHVYWDATAAYSDFENSGQDGRTFRGEIKLGWITNYKLTPFVRYYDEDNSGQISGGSSTESDSYGAGIRWLVNPRLLIDVSYNTPVGDDNDIDGKEQDDHIAATLKWDPTQRTQLEASYGQRFYGESYDFDLTHKNKRLQNTVKYSEDVKLFTRNNYETVALGNYWCPAGELTDRNSCLATDQSTIDFNDYQLIPLTDSILREDQDFSLEKQFSWSSTLTLTRTTFSLSLSDLTRENLNTRVEDETKRASFSIDRKISGKSSLRLNLSYSDNHFALKQSNERQDRYRKYGLEYKKSLNSRLDVTFGVSHLNRGSSTAIYNYDEERIYLNVSKGF